MQGRVLKPIVLTLAIALSRAAHANDADLSPPPVCAKPAAGFVGPFAPTKDVAEAIYRAYAAAAWPDLMKKFPLVTVTDAGDRWTITQASADKFHPIQRSRQLVVGADGKSYTVSATVSEVAGGELTLDIDKCTAAISHAALGG